MPRHLTHISLTVFAALLFCLTVAEAARQPQLKFLKTTDLPGIGLTLALMPDSQQRPVPSPRIYTYTAGGTGVKTDAYCPVELWRHTQQMGMWVDADDNALVLARPTHVCPEGFAKKHVTRDRFDMKLAESARESSKWTGELLCKWVGDFAGMTNVVATAVNRRPFSLSNLVEFSSDSKPANRLVYGLRLNPAAAGQRQATRDWFVVVFEINSLVDAQKAREQIEGVFFAKLSVPRASSRSTVHRKPVSCTRQVSDKSPEFEASRRQAVASIQNMADWWYEETDNYVILSNLEKRYRRLADDLRDSVETLRAVFSAAVPPRTEIKAVSVIRIFGSADEYVEYIGEQFKWSAGIWTPAKQELVIRPSEWGGSKDKQKQAMRVTYHEAFHQYVYFAFDRVPPSVWFNEGHAEFFKSVSMDNRGIIIQEDERAVRKLQELKAAAPGVLANLLALTHSNFYSADEEQRTFNYAMSWALVYYLRKGTLVKGGAAYAGVLDRYMEVLWETKNERQATETAFDNIDLVQLEHDFIEFWTSRNKRSLASRKRLFANIKPCK